MKKSIIYVGMDVHKKSIEVAFADAGRDGEVRSCGKIDGNLTALDKLIRKLEAKGFDLHFAYEAGPCGYEIYRHLSSNGYNRIVVASSMIPRQSGKRIKTDRRDAQMLARLHRAGELTSIYKTTGRIHEQESERGSSATKPGQVVTNPRISE